MYLALFSKELLDLLCPFYVQDEMIIAKSLNTLNGSCSIFTMNKVDKCKALWMKEMSRLKSNYHRSRFSHDPYNRS